jgi:predicted dinucleotide-binding enzyme
VVGAFHHLSARLLEDLSQPTLDGDVMVVGDVREPADDTFRTALAAAARACRGIYAVPAVLAPLDQRFQSRMSQYTS